MRLDHDELNCLLNPYPPRTAGHEEEKDLLAELDRLGQRMGYGALSQLVRFLYEVQCHGEFKDAVALKRGHFAALGWQLPEGFEDIARRYGA